MSKMQKKLSEIAEIQLGFPFRGKLEDLPAGHVCVIQPKDIDSNGEVNWGTVARVSLPGRAKPLYLKNGDILIPGKGRDNSPKRVFGIAEDQLVVASPYFFTVRVPHKALIDSRGAFIYWWLKQRPTRDYFSRYAAGSAVKNITKSVIENTLVILPSEAEMDEVIVCDVFIEQHTQTLYKLIENNKKVAEGIAQNLAAKYLVKSKNSN